MSCYLKDILNVYLETDHFIFLFFFLFIIQSFMVLSTIPSPRYLHCNFWTSRECWVIMLEESQDSGRSSGVGPGYSWGLGGGQLKKGKPKTQPSTAEVEDRAGWIQEETQERWDLHSLGASRRQLSPVDTLTLDLGDCGTQHPNNNDCSLFEVGKLQ